MQRLAELCSEEQRGGSESGNDGDEDAEQKGYGGLQRDDSAQHCEGHAGEAKEAERPPSLAEATGNAHGEAAPGDRQAREQNDVGELSVAVEFPSGLVS